MNFFGKCIVAAKTENGGDVSQIRDKINNTQKKRKAKFQKETLFFFFFSVVVRFLFFARCIIRSSIILSCSIGFVAAIGVQKFQQKIKRDNAMQKEKKKKKASTRQERE